MNFVLNTPIYLSINTCINRSIFSLCWYIYGYHLLWSKIQHAIPLRGQTINTWHLISSDIHSFRHSGNFSISPSLLEGHRTALIIPCLAQEGHGDMSFFSKMLAGRLKFQVYHFYGHIYFLRGDYYAPHSMLITYFQCIECFLSFHYLIDQALTIKCP